MVAVEHTSIDESGKIQYRRSDAERKIVEHSPILAMLWQSHAHLTVYKTVEHPVVTRDLIAYALKYTMKAEPEFKTNLVDTRGNPQGEEIRNRVISAEEAAARISSQSFVIKDVAVEFVSTLAPPFATASFGPGGQLQLDDVTIYLFRPEELARMTILDFFANYRIATASSEKSNRRRREMH